MSTRPPQFALRIAMESPECSDSEMRTWNGKPDPEGNAQVLLILIGYKLQNQISNKGRSNSLN
jgi:hypothetical protein